MRILKKLLNLMWKENKYLFLITVFFILVSALLTIFQAELGQAFFSAMNQESKNVIKEKINKNYLDKSNKNISNNYINNNDQGVEKNSNTKINENSKSNFKNIFKKLIKAKSLSEGITILLETHSILMIGFVGLLGILFFLIYELFFYFQNFSLIYLAFNSSISLQKEMFSKLLELPSLYFKSEGKAGDLISRIMNDIATIRNAIMGVFHSLFFTPILLIFSLYMLIKKNLYFTLILIITGTLGFFIINLISKFLKLLVLETRKKAASTADYLNKAIYGIDIIKIFNTSEEEKLKFSEVIKKYRDVYKKQISLSLLQRPLTEMIGAIIVIFIVLSGSFLIWNNKMTMNEIVGFIMYLLIITPHVQRLSKIIFNIKAADGASIRIYEILGMENENKFFGKKELKKFEGNIQFKNVYFSYSKILKNTNLDIERGIDTLINVNLTINKGEFVAIVGPSGAGKSTLANLIPALIFPTSGEILFDGENYQKFNLKSIRKYISYVPQEVILFPDSIYNNISYGIKNATKEKVIYYAKLANAHNFIINLPDGYNTILGERGAKLSGGQKQRIAIARALIKEPKVLILDEATSSLDSESEKLIQDAIFSIAHRQTTIVIAHRLSTILNADKIVVLSEGKITGIGTHQELLKTNKLYQKLYHMQTL